MTHPLNDPPRDITDVLPAPAAAQLTDEVRHRVNLTEQLRVVDHNIYLAEISVALLSDRKFGPGVAGAVETFRRDLAALRATRETLIAFGHLVEIVDVPAEILRSADRRRSSPGGSGSGAALASQAVGAATDTAASSPAVTSQGA